MVHYIYIPGFGDHFDFLRQLLLARWRTQDTAVHFVPMHWRDRTEAYGQKLERLRQIIEQIAPNEPIIIVGESAGGAMALYSLSQLPERINSVITICGYTKGAQDVSRYYRTHRPAFYPLVQGLDALQPDAKRITTIYSVRDHVVTPKHTLIKGAHSIKLQTPGHLSNIARVLFTKLPLRVPLFTE